MLLVSALCAVYDISRSGMVSSVFGTHHAPVNLLFGPCLFSSQPSQTPNFPLFLSPPPSSPTMPFALAVSRVFGGIGSRLSDIAFSIYLFSWDNVLQLLNLFSPNRKVGHVTPEGKPGFGGTWPEFVPPQPGDSRSCCPALNALANHGKYTTSSCK